MDSKALERILGDHFSEAKVTVRTEDNVHFFAEIVSPQFEGHSRIQRHRLVHQAVGERLGGEIHALSVRALTPEEAGVDS